MSAEEWKRAGLCLAGGLAAGLAWKLGTSGLAFAPLSVVAWGRSPRRGVAWGAMTLYFAGATSSLMVAAPRFLEVGWGESLLLWLGCASVLGGVWAAFWDESVSRIYKWAALRAFGAMVATALPPVGIIGLAHPALAAGVWFPGFGWVGLFAFLALVPWLQGGRGLTAMSAVALLGAVIAPAPPAAPEGWRAIDTELAHAPELSDFGQQFEVATASMERGSEVEGRVEIFPESAAGVWSDAMKDEWRNHLRGMRRRGERRLVVGALAPRAHGREYDSVALVLGPTGEVGRYTQRIPVPFAMWRPWAEQTVHAHWLGPGTVELDDRRVGVLICYEQSLLAPALQSIIQEAKALVVLGNGFWFRGTDAEAVGQTAVHAVGALFEIPVVSAFNR